MPRRLSDVPDQFREPHEVEVAGAWRLYIIAIGVVILLGLASGSAWLAWRYLAQQAGR